MKGRAAITTTRAGRVGVQGRSISLLLNAREVGHAYGCQHVERLLIDLNVIDHDCGPIRDEIHAALALLFLELERDSANGAFLDPAHEVGGEPGDLVAQSRRRDDHHLFEDLLVDVEVEVHPRVVPLDLLAG